MSSPIATAWVEIVPEMSKFSSQLRQEVGGATGAIDRQSRGLFGSIAGIAGKTIAGVGLAVAGVAATVAGIALSGGLNRALAIEQAEAKLTGLGHSVESVEAIMQNALDAVRGTAFGLGDAAGVAATIVASGIQPGEELTRVLSLVGDAATIAGTDMSSMGAIFAKVAASNKLQMDTINQLHDAGIPALQLVAQELGVTAEEAARLASKGEISFETFAAAMEEGLGGAALSAGETFTGAMANLRAALGRRGADFWTPLLENFTPVIGNLTGLVDDLGVAFGFATDGWSGTVETVALAVDGVITRIREAITSGENLGATITGVLEETPGGAILLGVLESLSGAFTEIREAVVGSGVPEALRDVGVELGGAIADALIEIGPNLPGIVTTFSDLVVALVPLIPAVADLAIELLPLVEALVELAAEDLLPTIIDGLGEAVPLLEDLVGVLTDASGVVGPMLDFWDTLFGLFDGADLEELQSGLDGIYELVAAADGFFAALGFDGYQEYFDAFMTSGESVVAFVFDRLIPGFEDLRDGVADAFALIDESTSFFLDNFEVGGVALGDILDDIKTGFLSVPGAAQDAWTLVQEAFLRARVNVMATVGSILIGLINTWHSLVALLPQPVREGLDGVLSEFRRIPDRIFTIVKQARSSFLTIGSSIVEGIAEGIRNGASAVANAIVGAVAGGAAAGKRSAEINSPSRLFEREIGAWLPAGIAQGVARNAHVIGDAINTALYDASANADTSGMDRLQQQLIATQQSAIAGSRVDSGVVYGGLRDDQPVQVIQHINMPNDDPAYVERVAGRSFQDAIAGVQL